MANDFLESDRTLARVLVERRLITERAAADALRDLEALAATGASPMPRLHDLLVERKLLSPGPMPTPTPDGALPARFGPYVIEGELGRGGAGIVLRARHEDLKRPVALKVLKDAAQAHPRLLERFQREATAAAKLRHPNIVVVHDAGRIDGIPFLAMELVEGGTLADRKISRRDAVALLAKVADAVQHAHELGIVHRDLKPANILIDSAGEPRVADFGLAHLAHETRLTRTGASVGTPVYMSPEQVRGADVGPRSDIYGLGVILYQLLTGRVPFDGSRIEEVYRKILVEDPPRPRRLAPDLPEDLETVCLKAIEKHPRRRYETADGLAADLRRWLAGEPIAARPPSTFRRVASYVGRRKPLAAAIAAALVVAAGFGAWRVVEAGRRSEAERRRADAVALLERGRPALDDAVRYLYDANASYDELVRRVDRSRALLEEATAKAPDLPLGHYLLGRAWDVFGEWDRAEECWRRAIAADPRFGPAHYRLGRLLITRTFIERLVTADERDVLRRPEPLAKEAADEIARAALDDDLDRKVAEAMIEFARVDDKRLQPIAREGIDRFGSRQGAEDFHWLLALTLEGQERLHALDRAIELCPKHAIALFCRGAWRPDPDGAVADYTRAIEIQPRFAAAWLNRGRERLDLGDFERAIVDFTRAAELQPSSAVAVGHRGVAKRRKRDLDGAIADCTRAIELSPRYTRARVDRGLVLQEKGDADAAIRDFTAAIDIDPRYAEALVNRAISFAAKGAFKDAVADCDRAIDVKPELYESWTTRGFARLNLQDLDGAAADFTRAIELQPAKAAAYINRADVRRLKGDIQGSLADVSKAIDLDPRPAAAYVNRGILRQTLSDVKGALEDYTRAIELNPREPAAYVNRGVCREATDRAGAAADYAKALEVAPKDWPHRARVEELLKAVGR